MQIDIAKYYFTKERLVQMVDKHTKVEIPKGYRIVDAREHKKDEEVTKKSEL